MKNNSGAKTAKLSFVKKDTAGENSIAKAMNNRLSNPISSLDDGCWADWTFPDDISEEEQAEIETAWEEEYFDGMEELGWRNDDTDYILQGPLELTDEEGNVVYSGEEE